MAARWLLQAGAAAPAWRVRVSAPGSPMRLRGSGFLHANVRRRLGAEANSAKATSPHLAEAKAEADAAAAAAKPDAAHHKHGEGHGDGHGDGHGHGSAEQEYVAEPFYGEDKNQDWRWPMLSFLFASCVAAPLIIATKPPAGFLPELQGVKVSPQAPVPGEILVPLPEHLKRKYKTAEEIKVDKWWEFETLREQVPKQHPKP